MPSSPDDPEASPCVAAGGRWAVGSVVVGWGRRKRDGVRNGGREKGNRHRESGSVWVVGTLQIWSSTLALRSLVARTHTHTHLHARARTHIQLTHGQPIISSPSPVTFSCPVLPSSTNTTTPTSTCPPIHTLVPRAVFPVLADKMRSDQHRRSRVQRCGGMFQA
jgi:hypothetical protein